MNEGERQTEGGRERIGGRMSETERQ